MNSPVYFFLYISILFFTFSCSDRNIYNESEKQNSYLYPYANETKNTVSEIILIASPSSLPESVKAEIPPLKYNKAWLFMLTQDDCKQAAYCRTWAAINGRPVPPSTDSLSLYYDPEQLAADDLPPNCYYLGKTLGSLDGCGNEVRFHFTTTLASEWAFMNASTTVKKGFTKNYYRFYMKSGLRWNNVKEMLNFGTGIAFHDVNTTSVENIDSILFHYQIAQDSIVKNLSGRGAKMLAEPNGNKTYVKAAYSFNDIQTMTAQTGTKELYPFKESTDISKALLSRFFKDDPADINPIIENELTTAKTERKAIHVGVHNTGDNWVGFLLWLNDTYGKDGDDSLWFPSQEEYYEYNYYRIHSSISTTVSGDTLRIRLTMPSGQYFYYPSLTLNVSGIQTENIRSISPSDAITGFSYANYEGGLMLNIDCRNQLVEHATHYVEVYETTKTSYALADARYFVNQLKDSATKEALLKRVE